jgi:hypothetical protein
MRRGHRRAHRRIWLFLLPLLLVGFAMALALRTPPAPPSPAPEVVMEAPR